MVQYHFVMFWNDCALTRVVYTVKLFFCHSPPRNPRGLFKATRGMDVCLL